MQNGRWGHSGGPPRINWLATVAPPPLLLAFVSPPPDFPHAAINSTDARIVAPRASLRDLRMGFPPSQRLWGAHPQDQGSPNLTGSTRTTFPAKKGFSSGGDAVRPAYQAPGWASAE